MSEQKDLLTIGTGGRYGNAPFLFPRPPKRIKPLGSQSPHVWSLEPAFGCNLACAHCCADLIPKERNNLMTEETWRAAFEILNEVSPTVRVDLCGYVGEPTLNKRLPELLPIARELAPLTQIQLTTNGTRLRAGDFTMKTLLDAGANILYIDQYGSHERFEELAEESGYPWYQYYEAPEGAPTPWKYWGPDQKVIVLMDEPSSWPKSRLKAGLLGNWYGNMNWERGEAQKRFGMKPLDEPLVRRCNQPFLYVTVASNGAYLLCCQDGLQVTNGKFGNVSEGVDGFRRFWFGKEMNTVRRRLRLKNRADTNYACQKCNITFSRCDFTHWKDEEVGRFWDGENWVEMPEEPGIDRFVRRSTE